MKRRLPFPLLPLACAVMTASALPAGPADPLASARDLCRALLLPVRAANAEGGAPDRSAPPAGYGRGVLYPWRVGIQAGHWKAAELPAELSGLRRSTGAEWRTLRESEVNLRIASAVARQLAEAGIRADVLPSTVPAGYRADAFVAIHSDVGRTAYDRGWKVATPWMASEAARALRDSVARGYGLRSGIPSDRYGVTAAMRGYYAFASDVFAHAVAPTTPSVILETGFLTSPEDRLVIADDPERAARGISDGIVSFLTAETVRGRSFPLPRPYPPMRVAARGAPVRYFPREDEPVTGILPRDTLVRPVGLQNGWVELVVWSGAGVFGWMKRSDLAPVDGG